MLDTNQNEKHPAHAIRLEQTTATGARRANIFEVSPNFIYPTFQQRIDLLFTNDVAMRRLAHTYGEGSAKYGDTNWMRGFEDKVLLNHAFEHLRKYMSGDRTEDHIAHAVWNLMTLMWTEEKRPDLMSLNQELDRANGATMNATAAIPPSPAFR